MAAIGFLAEAKWRTISSTRGIEADVFGGATSGNKQRIVIFGANLVEGGVQGKVVAALFGVGLISFEIVNAGANRVAGLFSRAHYVHGVPDHLQSLERHHYFVIFNVVSG